MKTTLSSVDQREQGLQALLRHRDNVIDLEIEVDDARKAVNRSVDRLHRAVIARDQASEQLADAIAAASCQPGIY